jgi:hypothetical protein
MTTTGTAFAQVSTTMPPRIPFGCLAIALLSTAVGGCSFAFVNGPPPNYKTSPFFDCTSGNVLPILDSVVGAGLLIDTIGAGTASGAFANSSGNTSASSRAGNAIALGAGAALLAASAGYGFKKTSECREAEDDLIRRAPVAPTFTGAPRQLAPPVPYDPWVARPPVAPDSPSVVPDSPPVAPRPPAATTIAPGAPAPAPSSPSPWDGPAPAK